MTTARSVVLAAALFSAACGSPAPPDTLNHDLAHAIVLQSNVVSTGRAIQNVPDFYVANVPAGATIHLHAAPGVAGGEPAVVVVSLTDPSGILLFATAGSGCPGCDGPHVNHCANFSYSATAGYQVDCPATTGGTFVVEILQHDGTDNLVPFHWDYLVSVGF